MGRANHIRCIDISTPNAQKILSCKIQYEKLEIALNTEYAIKNNEIVMLLSRGGDGVTNELWKIRVRICLPHLYPSKSFI